MLPYPQRPFGHASPEFPAAAGRRDRGEHTAGLRIDFLDAILGDLKQELTVEGRSCVRGDIDRAQHLAARRIERVQLVSASKPDVLTVPEPIGAGPLWTAVMGVALHALTMLTVTAAVAIATYE